MSTYRKTSSFGPKFLEALLTAARTGITIPCPDLRTAQAMRHRFYSLRRVMGEENHPDYDSVARTTFTIKNDTAIDKEFPFKLLGGAVDFQYDELLTRAGVAIPMAPELDD